MNNPEEEYSGFKTLGTDIDEAYSNNGWDSDADGDDLLEDDYSDE